MTFFIVADRWYLPDIIYIALVGRMQYKIIAFFNGAAFVYYLCM